MKTLESFSPEDISWLLQAVLYEALELHWRAGHHVFPSPLTLHRHRGNCNGTVKLGRAVIIELIYDFVTFLTAMPQQVDLCCQREKRKCDLKKKIIHEVNFPLALGDCCGGLMG